MENLKVTRAHLKNAVEKGNWNLLDKLLEMDASEIDDASLYTDTWGEWWGLLVECIRCQCVEGVKVLLKHGVKKKKGNWGDCIPYTPLEEAEMKKNQIIIDLLKSNERPIYYRKTDPDLPPLTSKDDLTNKQGEIRDETGLSFPFEGLKGFDDE
jgi:hypothetical protein